MCSFCFIKLPLSWLTRGFFSYYFLPPVLLRMGVIEWLGGCLASGQGQPTKQGYISNSYFGHIVLCCYPQKHWLKLQLCTLPLPCLFPPLFSEVKALHVSIKKKHLSTEERGSSIDFKDTILFRKKSQKHLEWVHADQVCLCFNTTYPQAKWEVQDSCIKSALNVHTEYVVWKNVMITFLIFKQLEQNWDQLN